MDRLVFSNGRKLVNNQLRVVKVGSREVRWLELGQSFLVKLRLQLFKYIREF